MEVRRMRADEVEPYREVRLRSLLEAPDAFFATYEEEAAFEHGVWLRRAVDGAESMEAASFILDRGDGQFGGTVFVRVNPYEPYDSMVAAMWLDADLRGDGWADRLLTMAEDFARAAGSAYVELWVEGDNPRARRFYERLGYVPSGISQPNRRGGFEHLLRKDLGGLYQSTPGF